MDIINQDDYAEIKWVEGGRVFPNLDCYGLVNKVRADMGLELWPDFEGVKKSGLDFNMREFLKQRIESAPAPGAMALVYKGGLVNHVAIVVKLANQLYVAECNPRKNVTFTALGRFVHQNPTLDFWL